MIRHMKSFVILGLVVMTILIIIGGLNMANKRTGDPNLLFSDEFNSPGIDQSVWGYEIGYIRNNELQYYTDRPENAYIENGNLVIEARREDYRGFAYTSASLNTQGKLSWMYGRMEMRARLPYGQGVWPAFWTMGENFPQVGWPICGEIDIMELIGGGKGRDDRVYGTLHWDYYGHISDQAYFDLPSGIFADEYHVFAINWTPTAIAWYVDDTAYSKLDLLQTGRDKAFFHAPHFILLNLAIGGNWPGQPDTATVFPQKYYIDYVRVYKYPADQ